MNPLDAHPTPITRLIANLSAADPQWAASLRGASPAEIDALARLIGQPLPAIYREFLQTMGHSMGWLQPSRLRFDITAQRLALISSPWRAPPGVLVIGAATDDPFLDVCLVAEGLGDGAVWRVVSMPQGPFDSLAAFERASTGSRALLAGSLPEFLGCIAYRTLRMALLPHTVYATTGPLATREIEKLPALLAPLGFRMSWFSNDWEQVHDSADAGLIATQFPGSVLALDIAATSVKRRDAIAQAVRDALGLPMRRI